MLTLIEATESEIPLIQQIAHHTWPITFGDILSKDQIEYMLDSMYSTESLRKQLHELGHRFVLAKRESQALAFISYEIYYQGKAQTKIHKIYILPKAQGLGLGRKLMGKAEQAALEAGNTRILLNVNKYNQAELFYQHLGYEVVGMEDIDIGSGFLMEDKIMEKKLL